MFILVCNGELSSKHFVHFYSIKFILDTNRPGCLVVLKFDIVLSESCKYFPSFADPRDSETFKPVDLHHGVEVRLGMSKGPVAPSFM